MNLRSEVFDRNGPGIGDILRAAWITQQAIGADGELVTRSALLYATLMMSGVAREVFRANGFDRREYEKGLGIRPRDVQPNSEARTEFEVHEGFHEGLEWYRAEFGDRPFDTIAMAAVILRISSGPLQQRLKEARLRTAPAIAGLRSYLLSKTNPNFQPAEILKTFDLAGSAAAVMARTGEIGARFQIAFRGITTSMLMAAMLGEQIGEDTSGPAFLRRWVRQRYGKVLDDAISSWMSFYTDAGEGERAISMPVIGILWEARDIAFRVSGIPAITGRHLAGAIIATRHLYTGAMEFLTTPPLDADLEELAEDFVEYLETEAPADREPDDIDEWRRILYITRDTTRVARFDAEGYDPNRDFLGTGADVRAFAKLIASKELKPPLSVGVFGDWGSGKSYFMRQLQDEIVRLARREDDTFRHSIVQIEFNAWHYVEANLWASLVENIFRNLKAVNDPEGRAEERTEQVIKQLGDAIAARAVAEEAVAKAQIARDQAASNLEIKQAELQRNVSALTAASVLDVWEFADKGAARAQLQSALNAAGISSLIKTDEDLRAAYAEIRGLAERGGTLWGSISRQPGSWWLLFAIALGAPILAVGLTFWIETLSPVTTQVATLAAGASAWIATQVSRVRSVMTTVARAKSSVDATLARAEQRRADLLQQEQAKLDVTTNELDAAKQTLATADQNVKDKQEVLLNLRAARQLARFIDDRSASDDYRKLLGVLATVRNDFERLTYLMNLQNDEKPLPKDLTPLPEKYRIDRIVLYIDDLDRCPPSRVVEVLQAVHLLLAFPLFVVIVGVDARWVRESLRYKHRNLWRAQNETSQLRGFVPGYEATPDDYLEKIFQIPFWLNPMTPSTTRRFVTRLLAENIEPEPDEQGGNMPAPETANTGGGAAEPGPDSPMSEEHLPQALSQKDEDDVRLLTLRERERRFMADLAQLIGRSPRSVKRYINTYRIIRAGVAAGRIDAFLNDREALPDYRAILLLLGVVVGAPNQAFDFFHLISTEQGDKSLADFAKALQPKGWDKIKLAVDLIAFQSPNARVKHLARHVRTVGRYSFQMQLPAA